jgi:DNA-binding MarR family transcriptional regulator
MTGDIGVTGPQRLVLRVVGLFPGTSAGVLATVMRVHPSTLTGVLQRLAAQRLLARTDAPNDRRRAVLRLTKRGARVNAARLGTVEAAIAQALRGISGRDRQATKRVLERLAAYLEPRTPGGSRTVRVSGRGRRKKVTTRDRLRKAIRQRRHIF